MLRLRWSSLVLILGLAWWQREWLRRLLVLLRRQRISGRVVSSRTGRSVAGVGVEARRIGDLTTFDSATTDSDGRFSVRAPEEETALWVDGRPVGFESGYLGFGHVVVATWDEAVSIGVGELSAPVRLDPL